MARGHSKRKLFTSFLGVAGDGIDGRKSSKFEEGLNSKVNVRCIAPLGK